MSRVGKQRRRSVFMTMVRRTAAGNELRAATTGRSRFVTPVEDSGEESQTTTRMYMHEPNFGIHGRCCFPSSSSRHSRHRRSPGEARDAAPSHLHEHMMMAMIMMIVNRPCASRKMPGPQPDRPLWQMVLSSFLFSRIGRFDERGA